MSGGTMPEQGGGGRKKKKALDAIINVVPAIDLLSCLITFLLYTAVWTQISRLQVQQLGHRARPSLATIEQQQKALAVTLAVGERGMALTVGDASYDIPSLGRSTEGAVLQDLKTLNTRLKAVKGEFPDQGSIIVTAEDTVPYGDLVHVIDACLGGRPDAGLRVSESRSAPAWPSSSPASAPPSGSQRSKVLGGKIMRGRKATNADLNVVPMVDMMTMLVIFLLQQFSATGEVLYMQKDIRLPDARHGQMIEQAPTVAISAEQVVVTGQKVADVADLDRDAGYLNIPALEERLREDKKRWDFIHQSDPNRKWDGIVNIQADQKVPFRIVKRVMYSCGVAGYFNLNFAALDIGSGSAAAQAATP